MKPNKKPTSFKNWHPFRAGTLSPIIWIPPETAGLYAGSAEYQLRWEEDVDEWCLEIFGGDPVAGFPTYVGTITDPDHKVVFQQYLVWKLTGDTSIFNPKDQQ